MGQGDPGRQHQAGVKRKRLRPIFHIVPFRECRCPVVSTKVIE
jgi:hypothetical protein